MLLINLNAEIVACILSFRISRHKPNLESTSKYGFSPDLGEKNGGILSTRMQVILDSSFARLGSAPIWGGKKGEFRDWTISTDALPTELRGQDSSRWGYNYPNGRLFSPDDEEIKSRVSLSFLHSFILLLLLFFPYFFLFYMAWRSPLGVMKSK